MPLIKDPKTGNMVQVDSRIYINEEGTMVVEGTRTPSGRRYIKKRREHEEIVKRNSEEGQLLEDRKSPGNGRFNPASYHWKQSKRYENEEFKDEPKESPLELMVEKPKMLITQSQNYSLKEKPYRTIEHQIA